jgi:hypothetical protein
MTQGPSGPPPAGPPPGWYQDPQDASLQRWWSGRDWTEHAQPAHAAQGAARPSPAVASAGPPQPAAAPPRKRPGLRKAAVISATIVAGLIIASAIDAALSHTSSGGSGSSGPCTTSSCVVSDARQSLVGEVAKDEAVMTSLSCRPSTVKEPDPQVWTVDCTAHYSDGMVADGVANVLMAKNQVTWSATAILSYGGG